MSQALRVTEAEYAAIVARRGPRAVSGVALPGEMVDTAKYKNVKTGRYASKREATHAERLKLLERAGEISDLEEQPKFLLIPAQPGMRPTFYYADFSYVDRDGVRHVIDVKGFRTEVYRLKKKLVAFVHNVVIEEV